MAWEVKYHPEFVPELLALDQQVRIQLLARAAMLAELGPALGRPTVDTLKGSSFKNMKEIRFNQDGVWRFAFAFDEERKAVILCGGDKEEEDQGKFYKDLIKVADGRLTAWVAEARKVAAKRSGK